MIKNVICGNCGRKLEYIPADIEQHRVTDYGGGSEMIKTIECPGCNERVVVK